VHLFQQQQQLANAPQTSDYSFVTTIVRERMTRLLQLLHRRDSVLNLFPPSHWAIDTGFNADEMIIAMSSEEDHNPLREMLHHVPFVFPFQDRIRLFRHVGLGEELG
jgi:hypothetical protein